MTAGRRGRVVVSLTYPQLEALYGAAVERAEQFAAGDMDYMTPADGAAEHGALIRGIDALAKVRAS